ncbi:MAG: AmiS/UreI transporter [Lachnospiraceae bacterium]|jgi:acid-activated urea channel|nr:AmiS/UreI transporter [Lachnospiraceae bacterium]
MATGIGLIYVGCVLLINGVGMINKYDSKALAVMNFFTGGIYVIINIINLANAVFTGQEIGAFYGVGTSMLFGFTYLFVGFTNLFKLDGGPLAWYCFFVGINTIPSSYLSFQSGDTRFGVIWLIWGALWLLYWVAGGLTKIKLNDKLVPWSTILVGIFTCWIPGYMLLANWW